MKLENQIPLNPMEDGTCRPIKSQYWKNSLANFVRRGGTELLPLRCVIVGQVYRSQQNGMVYDPNGIAPCICVGHHAGVEPRIIVYEDKKTRD